MKPDPATHLRALALSFDNATDPAVHLRAVAAAIDSLSSQAMRPTLDRFFTTRLLVRLTADADELKAIAGRIELQP